MTVMHFCFLRDTRRCRQKDDDTDDIILAAWGLELRTLPLLVASRGSSSILPSRRVMGEGEVLERVKLYWFLQTYRWEVISNTNIKVYRSYSSTDVSA